MLLIRLIALLLLINLLSFAQDTLRYEIKAGTIYLGEVNAIQTHFGNDSTRYRFESVLKVWSIYHIKYFMEAVYNQNVLKRSQSSIQVNGKNHHTCKTVLKGSIYYTINSENGKSTYQHPIYASVLPYYFKDYDGSDSVFSEYSGQLRGFSKISESLYVLNPDDPMEFYFKNGHISKVTVPNAILDFHIEAKDDNATKKILHQP